MTHDKTTPILTFRDLPSVNSLLDESAIHLLVEVYGRETVLTEVRHVLQETRSDLQNGNSDLTSIVFLIQQISQNLVEKFQLSLRPVINATGVILHTNLGRAPLSEAALEAVQQVAGSYSNLEFDLETGTRGKRQQHIEDLVSEVIGAEAAMVVNNNAAGVMLTLSALASGQEAVISRGQLVEIGGGFRMPDVMLQSGVKLVEVGTTNRTRLADYERAIRSETTILMQVHPSNFRMIGFTESVPLSELATLAHQHNLLCIDDLGSGALLDTAIYGLEHEPTVQESLAAGADVVLFSGDKLLGGPQAGIIVGKRAVLDRLKKHPLARTLRVDKMTIAALAATLDHYRRGNATTHIPIWSMIAMPLPQLRQIAEHWVALFGGFIVDGESVVGGGSLPGHTLPTALYVVPVASATQGQIALRDYNIPIIARVTENQLVLDPRTILPSQIEIVTAALRQLLN
ncbi:MAG: L-seryl-tRNA(Sec) selenium transferase [Anaerolineae bacterium]|nr:L-seryl-tRNA(Sec) selenium transferase [Anaerolineae bacterium]